MWHIESFAQIIYVQHSWLGMNWYISLVDVDASCVPCPAWTVLIQPGFPGSGTPGSGTSAHVSGSNGDPIYVQACLLQGANESLAAYQSSCKVTSVHFDAQNEMFAAKHSDQPCTSRIWWAAALKLVDHFLSVPGIPVHDSLQGEAFVFVKHAYGESPTIQIDAQQPGMNVHAVARDGPHRIWAQKAVLCSH